MPIFEIVTPGTRLDIHDFNWSSKISTQLRQLKTCFWEANAALNLFIREQSAADQDRDERERDDRRQREIEKAIELERADSRTSGDWAEIRFEAEIRFKRERWAEGRVPREIGHLPRVIAARAFIYALDTFQQMLAVLAKEKDVPVGVAEALAQFQKAFPDLREVRNSLHHVEDRVRGLGKNAQPLNPKPATIGGRLISNGGVQIMNGLSGSRYGSTMADGHYGEIDISVTSMNLLKYILEKILQSFKWSGSKEHAPNL